MTDKEKLKEITKLADAMYYAAFNLTTDASMLRKAMNEYRQFIINEYCKEEPVSNDLNIAARNFSNNIDNIRGSIGEQIRESFKAGAQWQKEHLRTIGDRTMGKAEKFIQDYTRNCSNVFVNPQLGGTEENHPWLTPDQAIRAVEIAREEVMDEVCDYIKNNLYKHLYVYDGQAGFPTHQFIADLKEIWKKNHCIE